MKKKEFFKKAIIAIIIVVCATFFSPLAEVSPYAAVIDKTTNYKSIVYGEEKESLKTVSEVARKISSYGVLADSSDHEKAKIYIDSDDFKRIAYLINSFNKQVSSTDTSNNRSYNNAIINKTISKNLFSKIGYGSSVSVPTSEIDGVENAGETKALSERILNSLR